MKKVATEHRGLVEELSSRITRHLCVGPAPRTKEDMQYIVQVLKCQTILNVANEEFLIEQDIKPKSEKKVLIGLKASATYKYINLKDGKKIKKKTMLQIIDFANSQLAKYGPNCSMYVHCHGGLSRSPAVVAIIIIGYGHNTDEVKKFLERNHPKTLIHPDIWSSIEKNAEKIKGKTQIEYSER